MNKCPNCGDELKTKSLLGGLVELVLKLWVAVMVVGIIIFILISVFTVFTDIEEEPKPSSPFLQLFQQK